MKIASLSTILVVLQLVIAPAWAADDLSLQRLATCQDSWLDWKRNDPVQLKKALDHIRSDFSPHDNDPYLIPKIETSLAGFRVAQLFPESVGMGVGFSVVVDASFDDSRRRFEKLLGKPLVKCETGDSMRMCALEIADQRTFMLMAEDNPKSTKTLVGCFYLYEK